MRARINLPTLRPARSDQDSRRMVGWVLAQPVDRWIVRQGECISRPLTSEPALSGRCRERNAEGAKREKRTGTVVALLLVGAARHVIGHARHLAHALLLNGAGNRRGSRFAGRKCCERRGNKSRRHQHSNQEIDRSPQMHLLIFPRRDQICKCRGSHDFGRSCEGERLTTFARSKTELVRRVQVWHTW